MIFLILFLKIFFTLYISLIAFYIVFVASDKQNNFYTIFPRITFVALLAVFSLFPYVKFFQYYISRYCFGKRKFTTTHNYSLDEILKRLFSCMPNETQLIEIDEKARNRIAIVQKLMEEELVEICGDDTLEMFLSGSIAECISVPLLPSWAEKQQMQLQHAILSDIDFMIFSKDATGSFISQCQGAKYFVNTDDPILNPEFFMLISNHDGQTMSARSLKNKLLSLTETITVNHFLDNELPTPYRKTCHCYVMRYAIAIAQGPAIQLILRYSFPFQFFYFDLTFAIRCLEWPDNIRNWRYRPDKLWPDISTINRITSFGCHFVPKSQLNDKEELTWRISFSKAEVELSKLVPPLARMCLIGLKVIKNDYLSVACGKVSSYHLKSLLFNTLERTDPQFWLQESNLTQCFYLLLEKLLSAVTERYCPHFFIPNINLFDQLSDCLLYTSPSPRDS